ncbi:hypothetical protein MTR_8g056070 [Medicago truncatula]|uniref:Uncharacterized protein n=1 Tax=Medicago truncatula TaxID=3880 RepID=G7LAY7_MEDTR|nr:hypothetical protein MTR_8g056070 [Medicago truncatula]
MFRGNATTTAATREGQLKILEVLINGEESQIKLECGNKDHIESIKELSDRVFNVIIGTEVAYVVEAILPLLNKIMIYLIIKKNHGSFYIKKKSRYHSLYKQL